jgi:hypothetical protein
MVERIMACIASFSGRRRISILLGDYNHEFFPSGQ